MHATVPFIGFAEAYVLARTIGTDHVLGSRRLYTDGAEVLYDYPARGHLGDRAGGPVVSRPDELSI
jgi:hypothetical protein